jgi:uncharacterized protein (TIGR02300 family)
LRARRILILTGRVEHGNSARIQTAMKESPLAKSEWGAKHLCESCGVKYYDMQRRPVTCPSCGEKATVVATRPRRGRNAAKPVADAPKTAPRAAGADGAADGAADDPPVNENGGKPDDAAADDDLLVDDGDNDAAAKEIIGGGVETNDKES